MSGTEIGAFDATSYRQRVLTRLRSAAGLDLSDPFFIVDLPVDVDDADLIRARIAALVAFWNKERSPNYKALAAELAGHRADLEALLLDPARRAERAAQVKAARAAADADRFAALDSLAGKLVSRYSGLPRSRLSGLARLARSRGIDDAAFAAWAGRQHVIEDGADAEPLPGAVRAQIRGDLDEFGRMTGDQARSATLWTFLSLAPTTSPDQIAARHAELAAQNDRRQHDHQMTVVANLLAYVRQHLIDGDAARYTASLIEDARDRIRDTVAEKVIVEGELSADDYEACVRRVMGYGYGLSSEQARLTVRRVATDLGATLAVAPAVDYLICPHCREPQPAAGQQACRYCGADLYVRCPACGRPTEAAAVACAHCGTSFVAFREASARIEQARAEAAAGRPLAASGLLADAKRTVPALAAEIDGLLAETERVISQARADWRATGRDLAGHKLYSAVHRVSRIAQVAADVPGPDGEDAATRLAELADRKAALQSEITTARSLSGAEAEAALGRILEAASDSSEAADLLASLPLAPPTGLRAHASPDAIALAWDPAQSGGPVSYKVSRLTSDPGGGPVQPRVLGSTSATEFEDAGVPGGAIVTHEVRAVSGRRTSAPVTTTAVLMARDVTGLTARPDPAGVTLTWSLPLSAGVVLIEREADPQAGLSLPPRRASADGQSWRDDDMIPGVAFRYRVFAEYRAADGTRVRTPGAAVTATLVPRPQPVREIWASTAAGRTTIGWVRPAAGQVRVYAADRPLAEPGAEVDLAGLASRARYVGAGQRRVSDGDPGRQIVTYTPVTVAGDLAVAGRSVQHLAVPAPARASVTDTGAELVLTFRLPPGVTEAVVAARRDAPPAGPHDPAAQTWVITNTKLEIDGGLHVPAPQDGRGWYFSIHSVRREGGTRLAAPRGPRLEVRTRTTPANRG